jgi:hypothetical protein
MPKASDFLSLLFEEHSRADGPQWECALGAWESQSRCLAARHHQGRHASIRQGLLAALASPYSCCRIAAMGLSPLHSRRFKAARAGVVWAAIPVVRAGQSLQVDSCGLIEQPPLSGGIQVIPESEHVGVPEIAEVIADFFETSVLGVLLLGIDFKMPPEGIEPPIAQLKVNRKEVGANTRARRRAGA